MPTDLRIFHNPRCRKSRETLGLIQEAGKDVTIVEYLKEHPKKEDIREILDKLDMSAEQIIRKGESVYKENFKGKNLSEEEWIQAIVEHPILIERPIVVKGDRAVIGRPPENVNTLLD